MAKCRHLANIVLPNYVLSNFIFIFWQEYIFVINGPKHYRRQYLSWIEIILLLLSQNHLMFSFLNLCRMNICYFLSWRLQQFRLFFVNLFNCWCSSDLLCNFDHLAQFTLLFDMILIYYGFNWLVDGCVLLALFWVVIVWRLLWVVIAFGYTICSNSFRHIWTCSVLDYVDVVAHHAAASTLDVSVWRWSTKYVDFASSCCSYYFWILIATCDSCVNLVRFWWNLNTMSASLLTNRPRRCWLLLFQ